MKENKPTQNDKELRLVQLKAALANAEREIRDIQASVVEVQERVEVFKRRIAASEKMHSVAMTGFTMLQPQWAFQQDPEYIAAQKELSDIDFFFKKVEMAQTLKQMSSAVDSYNDQVVSQTKSAEDLRKQIAELEA